MVKKKVVLDRVPNVIVPREPNKIYVYKRSWTLLNPIPYKWKMNREMLEKIKSLLNNEQA